MSKRNFEIVIDGVQYDIPTWVVIDGKGIEETGEHFTIKFVRGSKVGSENVQKHSGILHETLLSVIIHDLKLKNNLVPSRETSLAITKLEESRQWMEERQIERESRNVNATYQK